MEAATFRVQVDESRANRAIAELWTALVGQNVVYSRRFERGIFSASAQRSLHTVALTACALGVALSCYVLISVPVGCASFGFGLICLAVFGLFGLVFTRLLDLQESLQKRARRWAGAIFHKRAGKTLGPMRDASPVAVEYLLADDCVRGRWLRDGRVDREWERKLEAFAYVGEAVCAMFSKKTSQYPKIVMVHEDRESVTAMLEARGVEVSELPRDFPEEYGAVAI